MWVREGGGLHALGIQITTGEFYKQILLFYSILNDDIANMLALLVPFAYFINKNTSNSLKGFRDGLWRVPVFE